MFKESEGGGDTDTERLRGLGEDEGSGGASARQGDADARGPGTGPDRVDTASRRTRLTEDANVSLPRGPLLGADLGEPREPPDHVSGLMPPGAPSGWTRNTWGFVPARGTRKDSARLTDLTRFMGGSKLETLHVGVAGGRLGGPTNPLFPTPGGLFLRKSGYSPSTFLARPGSQPRSSAALERFVSNHSSERGSNHPLCQSGQGIWPYRDSSTPGSIFIVDKDQYRASEAIQMAFIQAPAMSLDPPRHASVSTPPATTLKKCPGFGTVVHRCACGCGEEVVTYGTRCDYADPVSG